MHRKGNSKKARRHRGGWLRPATWRAGAAGLLVLAFTAGASANPSGGQVKHGTVNITPGLEMQIQQLTDKAIVDWQSFSIGSAETVRILQPGQLSVILNRVVGVDPSTILGRLEANGNVFLINPNGILFGPGSMVNVGGLVASTLNITNEDFLAGRYNFVQDPNQKLAALVNQGTIRITDGGYAVLSAPGVINEGTIIARTGKVALAAGERSTLNLDGRDLVHYTLAGDVSQGSILLAPGMMSDALASTLGVPEARRADQLVRLPDGSVRLSHSSGTLVQSGTIQADGRAGVDAGSVILDSADLTLLDSGSVTTASGVGTDSAGGDVLILSEMNGNNSDRGNTVLLEGATVAARGGTSGDGGFVETSGDRMSLQAHPDLRAPGGDAGLLLIDPPNVRIVDGLAGGTTVGTETHYGDQFIEAQLILGDLLLDSTTDLRSEMTSASIDSAAFNLLTLQAATDVDLGNDVYNLGGGLVIASGTGVALASSQLSPQFLTITGTGGVDLGTSRIINDAATFNISVAGTGAAVAPVDFNASTVTVDDLSVFTDGDILLGESTVRVDDDITLESTATNLHTETATVIGGLNADDGVGVLSILIPGVVSKGGSLSQGFLTSDVILVLPDSVADRTESIDININSQAKEIRLSADALGNIFINDLARFLPGDSPEGLVLTRQDSFTGLGDAGSPGSITSATGSIQVATLGPMEIGMREFLGLGTSPTPDQGAPFVSSGGVGQTVVLRAGQLIDANNPNVPSVILEVSNPQGTVSLGSGSSIGGPLNTNREINVDAPNLEVSAGAGGDVFLANVNPDVDKLAFLMDGGELFFTPGAGATITYQESSPGGPLVLDWDGVVDADILVFVLRNGDLLVDSLVTDNQLVELKTLNGAVLDADPLSAVANVTQDLVDSQLILSGHGGIGTAAQPLIINGGSVALASAAGDIFLESQGPLDIVTLAAPQIFGSPAVDIVGAQALGSVDISTLAGSLTVTSAVTGSNGSVALDAATDLNATAAITAGTNADLQAGGSIDTSAAITAGGAIGLDAGGTVDTSIVTANGQIRILSGGTTDLNGLVSSANADILVDSSGAINVNQGLLAQSPGGDVVLESGDDIAVDQEIEAGGTVLLEATGAITQGANGLVTSQGLGLASGSSIGAANDPFAFQADTVTIDSGGSAFLRSVAGGVSLGQSLSVVGEGTVATDAVNGDLTLLVDDGSLAVDAALSVTGDLLLVSSGAGVTTLSLNQDVAVDGDAVLTSGSDLDLGQNVELSVGGNAVLRTGDDISQALGASVSAQELALSAGGDLSSANGGDFQVQATRLAMDVNGRAFVRQAGGDLELVGSVSAAGVNQTGGMVGGDMRVRLDQDGNLTVVDPYQAQNLALVTGTSLTTNQVGPGVSDIILDADLTAAQNMVILSAGNIDQLSGTLIAPNLGLGASGPIGGSGSPITFDADNLAVDQTNPVLSDSDGFVTTPQVTASLVTVSNQLVLPEPPTPEPPEPPTPEPPLNPESPENPSTPGSIFGDRGATSGRDPEGRLPEALSPDKADRIEQAIDDVLFADDLVTQERLLEWWDNEDLLRKKRRL